MSQFELTQIGIDAVNAAGTGGPKIDVVEFRVSNYDGPVIDPVDYINLTAMPGSTLHTGVVSGYTIAGPNDASWRLSMDQTVGTFDFDWVGLYHTNDGSDRVLFAIYKLPGKQAKTDIASGSPNVINFDATTTGVTNAAAIVNFTVYSAGIAKPVEVPNVESIPPAPVAPTNFYIGDTDETNSILRVFKKPDDLWSIAEKKILLSGTVTAGASTPLRIYSTDIGSSITGLVAGKYFIQFTSGAYKGLLRKITGTGLDYVEWTASLASTPTLGITFDILDSSYSYPPDASTTVKGIVELADDTETANGVDGTRAVTPSGLASIVSEAATAEKLAKRNASGQLSVATPTLNEHAANKEYADLVSLTTKEDILSGVQWGLVTKLGESANLANTGIPESVCVLNSSARFLFVTASAATSRIYLRILTRDTAGAISVVATYTSADLGFTADRLLVCPTAENSFLVVYQSSASTIGFREFEFDGTSTITELVYNNGFTGKELISLSRVSDTSVLFCYSDIGGSSSSVDLIEKVGLNWPTFPGTVISTPGSTPSAVCFMQAPMIYALCFTSTMQIRDDVGLLASITFPISRSVPRISALNKYDIALIANNSDTLEVFKYSPSSSTVTLNNAALLDIDLDSERGSLCAHKGGVVGLVNFQSAGNMRLHLYKIENSLDGPIELVS